MLTNFFNFLEAHRAGILLLFLCLAFGVLLVQWLSWILSIGRYRRSESAEEPAKDRRQYLRYIISDAAVKIINDFRHLLALVIVLIFAGVLTGALIQARASISDMKEALQAVVATLGGLVGSIIGYYFGESVKGRSTETPGISPEDVSQSPAVQSEERPIVDAPAPPPPEGI